MKKKRWLSILLSLSLLLTLVPTQALAEEVPEGTESACTRTADCPAQVHEPDCPLWQEDSTVPEENVPDETVPGEPDPDETVPGETGPDESSPGETGPDETSPEEPAEPGEPEETQPTALEQLLALAATLPDPAEVTADNADEVTAQLQTFTRLYADLTADEQEQDEVCDLLMRVYALQAALDALTGEGGGPAMLATTTGVAYIDAAYNEATGKVDYTPATTADDVTVVGSSSSTTVTWGTLGSTTWYVVNDPNGVIISGRIGVHGDVRLILADGCTLTASNGIIVPQNSSLTIYGQQSGTGKLIAQGGSESAGAGIGADAGGSSSSNGPITINGGTVTATGGNGGAGIGGDGNGNSGSNITVNGGTVTATGIEGGAGIGGGRQGSGSNITVNGGTVTATGGRNGAGIGGGQGIISGGSGSNITIRGGTVTATGGEAAAGIGGGQNGSGSDITISGGMVTATYGRPEGAAIGSGRGEDSSNHQGAEIEDTNFTNAVVLRQSSALGSTMTGQVYGSPTLTADATVPSGATLTVPAGSTLTIGEGVTLTNSGAICMEGGSLNSGSPNYGTLTNEGDGKLYYLLTVTGGTATVTDGMATYNGKTYAEEKATVTLTHTAEAKVGLAFNGEWTAIPASANVTFTKVDGTAETAESYQFTMPAQVLTVTAGYENAPTYTVTIPASVSIGDTATATIEATGVNVAEGYNLNVTLTATSGKDDAFTLALSGHPDVTLDYTMTLTKTTVKLGEDGTENTTEPNSTVSVGATVLTIPGGTADSSGSSALTFAMANQLKQYSGRYTGTVTFAVSVAHDEAPDDSDNTGDNPGDSGSTTTDTTGENP